jgi:hypothetical protein
MSSLAEYGWSRADLGLVRTDLVELANAVISSAARAKRDLPLSPESQFIQDAIDKRFGVSVSSKTRGRTVGQASDIEGGTERPFAPFSFERHCLEQAILILTQIDPGERADAFLRDMTVVVGPEYATYGIVFGPLGQAAGAAHTASLKTRLRCNDLARLQTATTSYLSAMNPTKRDGVVRHFSSPAASIGRRMAAPPPFHSTVTRVEIRSVANERLFTGDVIPVKGRLSLLWRTISTGAARVLFALSVVLVIASAALFAFFPDDGWWQWTEQLMGRLATGAFGALLVDSAIDYTALRRSLMAGAGHVTHGAVVKWVRAESR